MTNHLQGHFSLCNSFHRNFNDTWFDMAHSLNAKSHILELIAGTGLHCANFTLPMTSTSSDFNTFGEKIIILKLRSAIVLLKKVSFQHPSRNH